jgi:perosamine synthetase
MKHEISVKTEGGEGRENYIIREYERKLKTYFGAAYCLAVSSGTAALIAAMKVLEIKSPEEVITSPAAPLCTAYPILASGATLVFSDIRHDNFSLDPAGLAEKVTERTKAIVDVPMWGYPTPAEEMQKWAGERGIPLVFDLAHCTGTMRNGKSLSAYCDIACYSTQKNKIFSTGEGGFLLTDHEAYYEQALLYTRMGNLNGHDFGLNYKLSHLQAEAGISGIDKVECNLSLRRNNSRKITEGISHRNIALLPVLPGSLPSYQRLVLYTKDGRKGLAQYMEDKGIPSDIGKYAIKPLYDYPILEEYRAFCPNTERILSSMTTVAVHIGYTEEEMAYIIDTINSFPG